LILSGDFDSFAAITSRHTVENDMADTRSLIVSRYLSLTSEHTVAQAFWILSFAVLTAIGAQVEIPGKPVPFTLQTFFVLLAGALLGPRSGFLSMMLYLAIGAAGLPVFSTAGFGIAKLLGPTGGYLLAFPLAAFVVGWLVAKHEGYAWGLASMSVGLLIIFTLGTIQLNLVYLNDWLAAFESGFLVFSWWDLLKLFAASAIYQQFVRRSTREWKEGESS
jgi:biotin transport system substrate-specific component